MANVRCPMCSKLNPPEAEVCSYCGARIKPLRPSSSGPAQGVPGAARPSQNDEPDWLKDLRAGSPGGQLEDNEADKTSAAPGEESEVPDWLSRIRDRAKTETSSSSDLFSEDKEEDAGWMKGMQGDGTPDQGLDDWLSRLPGGESVPSEKAPPPAQPPAKTPGGEAPGFNPEPSDWLRGLGDESAGSSQAHPDEKPAFDLGPSTGSEASGSEASGSEAGEEDWMSKLSAWQAGFTKDASEPAVSGSADQPAAQGAEDEYDWLGSLGAKSDAPFEAPEQATSSGTGMEGFLSSLEGAQKDQPPAGEEPTGGPGAVFTEEGGFQLTTPETRPAHEEPSSGFGLTGFLSQIEESGAEPEPTPPAGEMREDIFAGWDQPAEAASGETAGQGEEPGGLDWLRGLERESSSKNVPGGQDMPFGEAPNEGAQDAAAEGDVPDWLREPGAETPVEPAGPFDTGTAGMPAWLTSETETPSQPEEQPFAQPPAFASDAAESASTPSGMPDWLSSDFAAAGEKAGEGTPWEETPGPATSGTDAGLPDWFASFDQSEVEKTQPSRVTGGLKPASEPLPPVPPSNQEAEAESAPAEEAVPADQAEGPDWLRAFQSSKEDTGAAISPLLSSAKALEQAGKEGDQPFTVDLPEWLGEEQTALQPEAQPESVGEESGEPAGEQLAQAELPDWVREMRPLESILPGEMPAGEADQRVEKAGPLAGLRGVLPVEEMATRYRKPPIYSVKLHVTEKQRTQATLLDSILSEESQSLLIPPERSHGTGILMRVIVAAFLLIVLGFTVVYSIGMMAEPDLARFPAENQMFEKINKRLQSSSNAPVLLAIEYEPGLSGEMRLAANALVDQLMAKDARIAIISTVPAGPAMGQQLLDDVSKGYVNTINLGYLPGGTMSLVGFAQQPRLAVIATLENQPAWSEDSLLKDVNGLGDFSQVIVLTDRAEIGRAWVEQVQPQLGSIPLFVVASMQAAPLLQPYVESGQIAGMTSGMLGGAMYAQLTKQDLKKDEQDLKKNKAFYYLPAYQVGVVLAFVVVLVGGIISGGIALFKRSDRDEE